MTLDRQRILGNFLNRIDELEQRVRALETQMTYGSAEYAIINKSTSQSVLGYTRTLILFDTIGADSLSMVDMYNHAITIPKGVFYIAGVTLEMEPWSVAPIVYITVNKAAGAYLPLCGAAVKDLSYRQILSTTSADYTTDRSVLQTYMFHTSSDQIYIYKASLWAMFIYR